MERMTTLLELDNVVKRFGGIEAVSGVSLALAEGELLCIIGPNGCGKTTLFNLISGAFAPTSGAMRYEGRDIAGLAAWRVARLGIGRKFQVPGIYPELTVRQNFDVPLFAEAGRCGLLGLLDSSEPDTGFDELLAMVRLDGKADRPAGELSHGEKQWLEIGMVLASRPRLMLLDEPTAGMTMGETEATADLLLEIHERTGIAAIVIEHDMGFVRRLGCPIAVMMRGAILCRGGYEEVSANAEVREAYLGERAPC
jgi:urea transport system ATP-binding protein